MKQSTKLDPAAAQAKSDRLAVGRIWEILHKASFEEQRTIAALAILQSILLSGVNCEMDFPVNFIKINRVVTDANKLLQEITSPAELSNLTLAILKNTQDE